MGDLYSPKENKCVSNCYLILVQAEFNQGKVPDQIAMMIYRSYKYDNSHHKKKNGLSIYMSILILNGERSYKTVYSFSESTLH